MLKIFPQVLKTAEIWLQQKFLSIPSLFKRRKRHPNLVHLKWNRRPQKEATERKDLSIFPQLGSEDMTSVVCPAFEIMLQTKSCMGKHLPMNAFHGDQDRLCWDLHLQPEVFCNITVTAERLSQIRPVGVSHQFQKNCLPNILGEDMHTQQISNILS